VASATPGGAPGYDEDKKFGNNIAHFLDQASQRLREHTGQTPDVKGRPPFKRDFVSVAGFRAFGEREFALPTMRIFSNNLVMAGCPGYPRPWLREHDSTWMPGTRPGMTA
jgi:hypothetical protein